ncbi:MAG: hypothetical protein GY767_11545 [Shimia sp.]|nr:hypothetical protein [Shimia sp.]
MLQRTSLLSKERLEGNGASENAAALMAKFYFAPENTNNADMAVLSSGTIQSISLVVCIRLIIISRLTGGTKVFQRLVATTPSMPMTVMVSFTVGRAMILTP